MKKSITLIFLMCFIMFATSFKSKNTLLDEQTKTYSDTPYVSIIDKCSITNGIILFDYDGNTYQIDTNIYSYYLTNDGISADVMIKPHQDRLDLLRLYIYEDTLRAYLHIDNYNDIYMLNLNLYSYESLSFIQKANEPTETVLRSISSGTGLIISYITNLLGEQPFYNHNQDVTLSRVATVFNLEKITSSDTEIKKYDPLAYDEKGGYDYKSIDDEIINYIPKEYFFQKGIHYYIGKEWGFIMNTTGVYFEQGCQYVTFIILDVEYTAPGNNGMTDYATISISPYKQFTLRACERNAFSTKESWTESLGFSDSLQQCVRPLPSYQGNDYYYHLKNVSLGIMIANADIKNFGEDGYNILNDTGDYITQASYRITNPSYINTSDHNSQSGCLELVKYLCGFIKIKGVDVGGIIGTIDGTINVVNAFKNKTPSYTGEASYNNGIYTLTDSVGNSNIYYQTDAANQASRYGGYVRTTVIQPDNQSGINCDPILLSCGKNSEAIAQFQFNRANAISSGNYTSSENMHLYAGISFELVEDNTSWGLFHWWKNGSLNIIASGVESTIYMGMFQRVK